MGVFNDKTGEQYGYLKVLERVANKGAKVAWLCQCQCGKQLTKRSDALKNNSMCPECERLYRQGFLLSPNGELHPTIKNEIGNTYGKLTVLEIDKEKSLEQRGVVWKCQCECGNITSVSGASLRKGLTTSCGCNHMIIEQPGTKYGMLTILQRIENSNAGKVKYLCQCDCGNTCEVVGSDLRSGQQKSCGCLKSKGEYTIIQLLQANNILYKKEATFDTCKDEKVLPFDFQIFISDKFYLIEYDGKQHTGIQHAWNEFSYENTKRHDEIKNQWCKDNNIPLIRIPYTHLQDLCIEDLQLETSQFIIT